MIQILVFVLALLLVGQKPFSSVRAQTVDTGVTAVTALDEIKKNIVDLQQKIIDLQGQEKTLKNQIDGFDNKIKLTELQIEATKNEIATLQKNINATGVIISQLETSLNSMAKILLNRIASTYESSQTPPFAFLFSADSLKNYVRKVTYLRYAQVHDKQRLVDVQVTQNDYQAQKQKLEDQKKQKDILQKQLVKYTADLNNQKNAKKDLLAQTKGSESQYLKLLAQTQAQLANFSRFVASQGGDSLLANQTNCDSWGCYYNQRDTQWGSLPLNNTRYTLASDGCLLTDMAMIFTHYGHKSVNPITINSNPANFASYEPAWLNKTIFADGATADRINAAIDGELSSGRPIIVGISYDNGPLPDHFVVLISGSSGRYQMHDPYQKDGHNISFNDHYTVGSIREINRVVIN